MDGDTLIDRSMTPKLCLSYCIDEKRYSLFAIRGVGCGLECSGDAKETCGGKSAVSVFGKSPDWFADDFDDGTMSRWTKHGGSFDASSKSLVAGHAWGGKALVKDHEFSDSTLEVDVSLSRDHTGDAGAIFRAGGITSGIDGYTGYYAGITSSGRVVLGRANNDWKEIRSRLIGIDRGRVYRLKVVATEPSISVFVDDMKTPRIVARDETHARGRTGVRVFNTGATFDSVRIGPPPVQPMIIEDFAGDKLSPSWTTYGGSFTVSDRSLVAGKSYGGKAVLNVTASDFEPDVFVRLADKSGDAGLIFRVNDAAVGGDSLRGYYVGITGSSRRVLLGKIDYAWKQIGEARLDGRASGSYALGVRADGKSISVSVDDEVKIKADDDSFVGGGAVGVRVYDTGAAFSHFRLIRL